jgi:hypothetical protein
MVNKKLLIGLAIICGQVTNSQAISNGTQLTLAGLSGITTEVLTYKLLTSFDVNKFLTYVSNDLKDLDPKLITYSCALGATALTAWNLYSLTPGAKLQKVRATIEQINQNPLISIYANDAYIYNEAVLRLLVRDEYPLLTAFRELELIDDLIDENIALLNQALDDTYASFTKANDLDWELASLDLLKQKVNDRLCFIKYSRAFNNE